MRYIDIALIVGGIALPASAAATGRTAPLFPDAPPPPQVAPASVATCCTDTGRFVWIALSPDKSAIEGATCEANTSDGLKPGNICY